MRHPSGDNTTAMKPALFRMSVSWSVPMWVCKATAGELRGDSPGSRTMLFCVSPPINRYKLLRLAARHCGRWHIPQARLFFEVGLRQALEVLLGFVNAPLRLQLLISWRRPCVMSFVFLGWWW